MHLLIAHAAANGSHCQEALRQLQLPHLASLLKRLTPIALHHGNASHYTPLDETVRAEAVGLSGPDGLLPWAALEARHRGLHTAAPEARPKGWAWITPCHWQVNADHVEMLDPRDLALTAEESTTLMQAMQGYFAEDGITLYAGAKGTWLAHGSVFKSLPTASLERARGARVDTWMPRQPQAKALRRLQNEMQMLLYAHPLNDVRLAAGQATVNSFWVSGTGDLPDTYLATQVHDTCTVCDDLRETALRDDAAGWLAAWRTLDSTVLAALTMHAPLQLTLCGEQHAQTWGLQQAPWWRRLQQHLTAPTPAQLLASL